MTETEQELIKRMAFQLFDIWKEAKSSEEDNWDNVLFEQLSEKEKAEYYLTAKRFVGYYKEALPALAREAGYGMPIDNDGTALIAYHHAWAKANGYVKLKEWGIDGK